MTKRLIQYYERDAVSQSALKALYKGVGFYQKEKKFYFKEKEHWVIGDAVDVKISRPEDFDDEFYIGKIDKKPKGSGASIAKYVWDCLGNDAYDVISNVYEYFEEMVKIKKEPPLKNYSEEVMSNIKLLAEYFKEGFEMHEYGGEEWTLIRKITTVMKSVLPYWKVMVDAGGRQIISKDELKIVNRVVDKIKNTPMVAEFIYDNRLTRQFQMELNWEKDGIPCKGLIDIWVRNDTSAPITFSCGIVLQVGEQLVIDLKTTSRPAYRIEHSIREYRYDIQLAWYHEGLIQGNLNPFAPIDPEKVRCVILAVSTLEDDYPVVWEMTKEDLEIARWGAMRVGFNEYIPYFDISSAIMEKDEILQLTPEEMDLHGYEAMFNTYCKHDQENVWDMPIELYHNKGLIRRLLW